MLLCKSKAVLWRRKPRDAARLR